MSRSQRHTVEIHQEEGTADYAALPDAVKDYDTTPPAAQPHAQPHAQPQNPPAQPPGGTQGP